MQDPAQVRLARVNRTCAVAYLIPDSHGQQLEALAKFGMIVVPQQMTMGRGSAWKDAIRSVNPDAIILGYQMLSEETNAADRGPGDLVMASLSGGTPDAYMRNGPNGDDTGTITLNQSNGLKLFDYRKRVYRDGILSALDAVMASYPYDGFFLDNCNVFQAHHPQASVRQACMESLKALTSQIRGRFPNSVIIGNGPRKFPGLNGEMNENRPADFRAELSPYAGHEQPEAPVSVWQLSSENDAEFRAVYERGKDINPMTFWGSYVTPQSVKWFQTHDIIVAESRHRLAPADIVRG